MLLDDARGGAPEGRVVVADHQTAGRGRLGRQWQSPSGASLLASVLLRPQLPVRRLHLVSMVTGLAARAACQRAAGCSPALKWPNDLVVEMPDGVRKLGGILAEGELHGTSAAFVVVGIGINVNWAAPLPSELTATAVAINQVVGREVDREALLVDFLVALEEHYAALGQPAGIERALDEYRVACSTLGTEVRAELARGTVTGRATDIDPDGHLTIVDADGHTVTVTAGDVVHLRGSGIEVPRQQLGEGG